MRRVLRVACSVAICASAFVVAGGTAHAATVPVTLNITRMSVIEDPDPSPGQGVADFKANVTIDGTAFPTNSEKSDQSPGKK